jgi:hypothetical protein
MGKKLEGNGMWESSRMMLPEHREVIIQSNKEVFVQSRPVLDEQEIELVNSAIRASLLKKDKVELTLYDVYQFTTVTGTIERVDHILKQVKFVHFDPYSEEEEWEWIPLQDIMKAEIKESKVWEDFERFDF